MTLLAPALLLLAPMGAFAPQPPAPGQTPGLAVGDRAGVELGCDVPRAFVGQAIHVTVLVRIEQRLWREQLIQLFRQQTDLAVRLATPWAEPVDGLEVLGVQPHAAGAQATAVVDGAVAALRRLDDETRGGETFARFELVHRLIPKRAGTHVIRPAELHFAWAARFVEDFLGERVPQGREDAALTSASLTIEVAELPLAGRPPAFTGLVGRVAAEARLETAAALRVGETVMLHLTVTGDGDLRPFRVPSLADLPGFWVRGVREETERGRRTVVYELAAHRVGSHSIPRIEVPFFAPDTATYELASSAPIGVAVAPGADGASSLDGSGERGGDGRVGGVATTATPDEKTTAAPVPGIDVLFGPLPVRRLAAAGPPPDFAIAAPPLPAVVAAWLAAPWLAIAVLAGLRRRARTWPERMRRHRRRAALRALQQALAGPERERAAAVVTYLATWLDCAEAAVVGRDLPQRLVAIGVETGLAERVDAVLDALAAPRFGAEHPPPSNASVRELAAEVDRQVRAHERRLRTAPTAVAAALALALAAAPANAQQHPTGTSLDDLPTQAGRLLDAGDAARAFELYRRALDAGTHDAAALCFDLATCTHRLGRPAESVLWYERALVVEPTHFEARANLRLVRQQLGLADPGQRALARVAVDGVVASVVALGLGVAFALGGALQLSGALLFWLRHRRVAGGSLVALGLAVAIAAAAHGLSRAGEPAVVLRDGVRLLAEPHERAGAIGSLQPGHTIEVLESSPRWARVRQAGSLGWVDAQAFARVAMR